MHHYSTEISDADADGNHVVTLIRRPEAALGRPRMLFGRPFGVTIVERITVAGLCAAVLVAKHLKAQYERGQS